MERNLKPWNGNNSSIYNMLLKKDLVFYLSHVNNSGAEQQQSVESGEISGPFACFCSIFYCTSDSLMYTLSGAAEYGSKYRVQRLRQSGASG